MFDKRKDNKQGSLNPNENSAVQSQDPVSYNAQPASGVAIIGPGIIINGDISGEENLIVKGRVDGKIVLNSNEVTIDTSANVTASISAKTVQVTGTVNGDITGNEKVVISKSGKVQGNIVAPRVILEDGAVFKGSIDMNPAVVAKEAPVAATSKKSHVQAVAKEASKKESSIGLN